MTGLKQVQRWAIVVSILLVSASASASPQIGWGYINAVDAPYLAVGDGLVDDGVAIQKALDDVGNGGGGRVFLPAGVYRVTGHLSIPANTTLSGVFTGPPKSVRDLWPAPNPTIPKVAGTMLLAFEGKGNPGASPFITLASYNATLEGLAIYYPEQITANPPLSYPWTIALAPWPTSGPQTFGAENATIQNVVLVNSFNGIDLASQPSSRHMIRGVYGQPLRTGIQVDQCWDVGRISDVHFNQLWSSNAAIATYQRDNGFAFVFFRTDGELVHDIVVYGYHVAMLFSKSPLTSPTSKTCFNIDCSPDMQLTNIYVDGSDVGLDVYDTKPQGISVTNFAYANQGTGGSRIGVLQHAGTRGYVSLTNGKFWGPMQQAVQWSGTGSLSLSNSHVIQWGRRLSGVLDNTMAAIDIRNGKAMIQNTLFFPQSAPLRGISVSSGDRVMVTGNMMVANTIVLWPSAVMTMSSMNQP
jgi:hypothetical protein